MRSKAKLRQEDMEDYGVNWKHYQDIEAGRVNPTYLTFLKLAKAFKCAVKDFIP